jgi:diacylglycerol kinase (ATP)
LKPLVIVNPRSNGGHTGRIFGAMRSTLEQALGAFALEMTERPGHATDLAREGARSGHPLVIAVGGDGTIHEVVTGLMQAKTDARLGIIGQGTGGDLRKTLGMEHRLDRYLEAITSGKERALDVGKYSGGGVTDGTFINILSAGMSGLVDRYVANTSRALGGKAAYFGASLKALFGAQLGVVRCRVTREGITEEHVLRSFMIAICNGKYFGGGMKIAPMAEVDDGTFELVALGATSKLGLALSSQTLYSGEHMKHASTVHLRGQSFQLELINEHVRDAFVLDVDGEPKGSLPLRVDVLPKALILRG